MGILQTFFQTYMSLLKLNRFETVVLQNFSSTTSCMKYSPNFKKLFTRH